MVVAKMVFSPVNARNYYDTWLPICDHSQPIKQGSTVALSGCLSE
jgi:hypothetical protein